MQQDHTPNRVEDAQLDSIIDAPVTLTTPSTTTEVGQAADNTAHDTANGDIQHQHEEVLPVYAKDIEAETAGPFAEPTSADTVAQTSNVRHDTKGVHDSNGNVNAPSASTVDNLELPSATSADKAEPQAAAVEQEAHNTQSEEAATRTSTGEQEWPLKSILWPPFAQYPQEVKILMQDVNGPCSFLALCNVLLLRGDLRLPLEQKTATFSELSSQVGDYLLRNSTAVSTSLETNSDPPTNNLDFALNTLPKTLSGLDVNVNFITGGFSESQDSSSSSSYSELELFKLAKVDFKHGWIVSQDDDKDVYEVLLTVANDYDTAVNVLVEGDAIAQGHITGNSTSARSPTVVGGKGADSGEAGDIQSPASYTGLFKLSNEVLKPNSLCALFRNSHFSVLYRRPNDIPPSRVAEDAQPFSNEAVQESKLPQATLFQLVTDQALLHEPNAIWESLEDVDGSASQFFDSRLQPARIRQDWVSRSARDTAQIQQHDQMQDADMALAAQLQQDEYDAEDRPRQNRPAGNNNNDNSNANVRRSVQFAGLPTQYTSNQSDQSNSGRRPSAGKRPEELDPRVLSSLGAQSTKKPKEKSSEDKKGKKGCVIC